MEPITFWTLIVAAYGAVLSTVAVGWNLIRDLTDRGRLSVTAMIAKKLDDPTGPDYFVVTMTNVGRQPLMVRGYGGYFKREARQRHKGAFLVTSTGLPRMLAPTGYHLEWTRDFGVLDKDVARIVVYDTLGREYDLPRKLLRDLQRQYAERQREGKTGK